MWSSFRKYSMRIGSSLIMALIVLFGAVLALIGCRHKTISTGERYVVLSPEIAEIIVSLGAGDMIVGVTEECTYPQELADKPRVGKFGSINKEAVLSLKPTMVFTSSLEQDAISAEMEKLGMQVEQVYPKTINELVQAIRFLGDKVQRKEAAKHLGVEIRAVLDSVGLASVGKAKPKVYLEIYRDPLMSVSDASMVGQLLEAAGGDNVFKVLERDYARISPEDVINAAPDIMICYSQDTLNNIKARKGWQNIPAIKNNHVYFEADINPDWIQRAGPRIVHGLKRLREIYDIWAKATGK